MGIRRFCRRAGVSGRQIGFTLAAGLAVEAVKDDMGTLPIRRPSNRSNRFEVANLINSALSTSREAAGPFWCSAAKAAYLHFLSANRTNHLPRPKAI
jgi:hypothetical protein